MIDEKQPLTTARLEQDFVHPLLDSDLTRPIEALRADLDHARAKIRFLEQLAFEDQLLPILNRKAFLREATRMLLQRNRQQFEMSFYYVNVDRFREVNEAFGHDGGDALLLHLCGVIGQMMRSSDILGRIGADEFGALLVHANAESMAEKCHALETRLHTTHLVRVGRSIPFRVSWSLLSCDGFFSMEDILERAKMEVRQERAQRAETRRAQGESAQG